MYSSNFSIPSYNFKPQIIDFWTFSLNSYLITSAKVHEHSLYQVLNSWKQGHPLRRELLPATALVCFDYYWPSFAAGTLFSGRLPCFISWSWCWCSALHTPSGLRVSFPEPCPNPDKLWIPARVWNRNAILSSTYAACGIARMFFAYEVVNMSTI